MASRHRDGPRPGRPTHAGRVRTGGDSDSLTSSSVRSSDAGIAMGSPPLAPRLTVRGRSEPSLFVAPTLAPGRHDRPPGGFGRSDGSETSGTCPHVPMCIA